MLFSLRPPELLGLRIDQYSELTLRDARPPPDTLTTHNIYDWRSHGLRDLLGHRIWLLPELFSTALPIDVARRLGHPDFAAEALRFIHTRSEDLLWLSNVIKLDVQPRLFVTSRLAPMHGYKWFCQQLLLAAPFDNEERLLRSPDLLTDLEHLHIIDRRNPEEILHRFVLDNLAYWPVPYTTFWNVIRNSWVTLQGFATGTLTETFALDIAVTSPQLTDAHDEAYLAFLEAIKTSHDGMLAALPPWQMDEHQTAASWDEQQRAFALIKATPSITSIIAPRTYVIIHQSSH